MLAPGCARAASGKLLVHTSNDPVPDHYSCGNPFDNQDRLRIASKAVDTNDPSVAGIRRTQNGAMYGTKTTDPSDVIRGGYRVSALGQVVYSTGSATTYANGNPVDNSGLVCVDETIT